MTQKILRCPNCGCLAGTGTPLRTEEEIQAELATLRDSDFAQPTPAKPLQPDCMFMAALDSEPHQEAFIQSRLRPARLAPIATVTSNGNPILL
jgi:hypothetical protein